MSRRDRRRKNSGDDGTGDWLTTYSDLVTLLLCFFVLLFSFSEIDAEKFRQISHSLKIGFEGGTGVLDGQESIDVDLEDLEDLITDSSEGERTEDDLEVLYQQLQKYSKELDLDSQVMVNMEERGVVLRFEDNVFFDSGSAEIKPESKKILDSAALILNKDEFSKRHIRIEGHTDSVRIIYSKKYETNWELSSARAINVLRYLTEINGMDSTRISGTGYSKYRPIDSNETVEGRARNRRVDIVILKDAYEKLEPGGSKDE